MILLEAYQVKQYANDRLIFDIKQLRIHDGDRIGLIGPNGSGKTTLLHVLAKKIVPETGTVKRHAHIELLPQLKRTDTLKSGGEVTKQYIQHAFKQEQGILLADEPTTNLDREHVEWLESKMDEWQGAYVVVSHDRAFLDATCTTIWELQDGRLTEYKGNYSEYKQQKELELLHQQTEYEKYTAKKKQLEEALRLKQQKAERATKKPKKVSSSEAKITGAKPYFAKKQKTLQKTGKAIEKRLEKLEKVEKVREEPVVKMNVLNEDVVKNRIIIRFEDVACQIGERTLWNKARFYIRGGEKIALIGPNGSGKTTLLKKIVNGDNHNITISSSIKIGYFRQDLSILDEEKSILENVQVSSKQDETFIRTVLARLHFVRDDVYKKVAVLSGGERVKVALAKIFVSDSNVLILDEPTNFLDIYAMEALESLLQEYEGTVLFVSHDRTFVKNIATKIFAIENEEIIVFDGTYDQFTKERSEEKDEENNDKLLVLETKISEVLSRLSIEPSEELEREFEQLVNEKRKLLANK